MKYVLDASVAICLVIPRPLAPKAVRLRDEYQRQIQIQKKTVPDAGLHELRAATIPARRLRPGAAMPGRGPLPPQRVDRQVAGGAVGEFRHKSIDDSSSFPSSHGTSCARRCRRTDARKTKRGRVAGPQDSSSKALLRADAIAAGMDVRRGELSDGAITPPSGCGGRIRTA